MRISDWSSDVCSSDLEARHLCADHRFFDGFDRCQDIESFRFRALRNAFVVIVESGRRRGWRRNGSAVTCRRCLLSAKEAAEQSCDAHPVIFPPLSPMLVSSIALPVAPSKTSRISEERRVGTECVHKSKSTW